MEQLILINGIEVKISIPEDLAWIDKREKLLDPDTYDKFISDMKEV